MPVESTNPELIEAACKGDTTAIEQVLLLYHPMITRLARKYCATPEDVEDAVQETLWIASRKIGTLRVASAVVSWLFRIVRNECYRLLHHKSQEEEYDFIEMDTFVHLNEINPSNPERETSLKNDVILALAKLPQSQREVLILRDLEGLTGPEVALELGISIEAVKSRLHYARDSLRDSLRHWQE